MQEPYIVKDNFLTDERVLNVIRRRYVSNLKFGWKANNQLDYDFGHWNHQILKDSRMFPYDMSILPQAYKHPEVQLIWQDVKKVIGDRILVRCYINAYTYGTDGYAHLDDIWINKKYPDALSETVIVYLNPEWNRDWAGETVVYWGDTDNILVSVLPRPGRLLVFNSNLWHAARPLSRACKPLRYILVFKTADKRLNSPEIDYLLPKTLDIPHTGRTLFEHLYSVAARLEADKEPRELCLAGLFHSVYGTDTFISGKPERFTRDEVKQVIGESSEHLVHIFCTLQRRTQSIITNAGGWSPEVHQNLLKLERANLADQNQNGKENKRLREINEALAQYSK